MMSRLILRLHGAALSSLSITLVGRSVEQMPTVGMVFATSLEGTDEEPPEEDKYNLDS